MQQRNDYCSGIKKDSHFAWLDIIRFSAALAVVLCHARGFFLPEYANLPANQRNIYSFTFYAFTRLGNEAVITFFILSGFLVGGKGISRMLTGTFDLKNYAIDRIVRITLPLLGALLFYLFFAWSTGDTVNWNTWFGNLFSLQGILCSSIVEPFWSLSYEVWFYILLGGVGCLLFTSHTNFRYAGWFLLVACACVFIKLKALYLFIWLLGAIAYFFVPERPRWKIFLIWLLCCFAALILCQISFTSNAFPEMVKISQPHAFLGLATSMGLMISQLVRFHPENYFTIALNNLGTRLASFSYTLYLTHVTTFRILQKCNILRKEELSLSAIIYYIFAIVIAIFVAVVLFWCFEKHTRWVKEKIKKALNSSFDLKN